MIGSAIIFLVTGSLADYQQSSKFKYVYPAAANPVETIASAVSLIICSFMSHPYLFHGFQPIGGVLPNPLSNPYMVTRMTQINKCLYINFNILIGKKNDLKLSNSSK